MSDPFLGEIKMFGGNFAPRGYSLCNGQLVAVSQNTALFALLGTVYGGNGTSTFGLPNFQGWRASFFSPQLNSLIDQAGVERDAGQRLNLYHQAQKIYDEQVGPIMMISQMTDTVVSAADVKGFAGDDAEATRYLGVYKQR